MIPIPKATLIVVVGGYTFIVTMTLTLSKNIEFSRTMIENMHSFVP